MGSRTPQGRKAAATRAELKDGIVLQETRAGIMTLLDHAVDADDEARVRMAVCSARVRSPRSVPFSIKMGACRRLWQPGMVPSDGQSH